MILSEHAPFLNNKAFVFSDLLQVKTDELSFKNMTVIINTGLKMYGHYV